MRFPALIARWRGRLVWRIYAVGMVQVLIIALGFLAVRELNRSALRGQPEREDALVDELRPLLDDPGSLQRKLDATEKRVQASTTVFSPEQKVLATTAEPGLPACPHPDLGPPAHHGGGGPPPDRGPPEQHRPKGPPPGIDGGPLCRVVRVRFPDGRVGLIEFRPRVDLPVSPFTWSVLLMMLVVVGVTSVLLARSIARPLERLSKTAETLGGGDLEARSGLAGEDELGRLGRAFDDMAREIASLVASERELVANISHELRTPLARIRVALDIAREGDVAVAQKSLADITDDLLELETLVTNVLTASRLERSSHDGLPLERGVVDVEEMLSKSMRRFASLHPDHELEPLLGTDLPELEGDPMLLKRAVDNLLDNAAKYSPPEAGSIELLAIVRGEQLVVEVSDHGQGMSEEELAQAFTPFYRADPSRTRSTGGHGLGLALVRRIAEVHGGTVSLESALGEGTRAELLLPITTQLRGGPS